MSSEHFGNQLTHFFLTLPRKLFEKYNIKEGEELYVVEGSRGFTLTPYDPDFE
ncbi:MAG: AbrB/MazE/SpoVT family DNA-binding domain-containing protein [Dethiobacter sp.]